MERFTEANLASIKPGWYWAKEFEGASPCAVPVYWKHVPTDPSGPRLVIDFGYRSELNWYPNDPENSDGTEGLVLIGPLQVPEELL